MQIIKELKNIPNLALALGFFDGIHLGHRAVIESAINFSHQCGVKSAVITFDIQPYCYFNRVSPQYIVPRTQSYSEIEQMGIDYIFELNFESICKYSAGEYLDMVVENLSPVSISTGDNHHLGVDNASADFIESYYNKADYKYFRISSKSVGGEVVSSSAIRNYLMCGNISKANAMLGRKYSVSGSVQKGNQIGRTIGFPTINIYYPDEIVNIPFGVYKTSVEVNGKSYNGISNFGVKPTISSSLIPILETHIIDFSGDLYGEKVTVFFDKMIRPEIKFSSLDELKNQIKIDLASVK